MKNIVLYLSLSLGILAAGTDVNAQKPVLELIPANHQVQYSDTAPDTAFADREWREIRFGTDSLAAIVPAPEPPLPGTMDTGRTGAGSRSFFMKGEEVAGKDRRKFNPPSLMFRYIHPFHLFVQITALK